jgi:tRNA threonylcarbamoyl adenosine modification protein YeaZ
MIVLTIDTATPAVIAGLVRRGVSRFDVVAERVTIDARAHAERLTPNVLDALADAARAFADIDAVVVGCGPGPFTGLRVGMATAAAYGHALDVPVYGVCSLDAIGVHTRGDVLVVTDARRREVYWARYRDGVRVAGPAVDAPADVPVDQVRAVAGSPPHAAHFDLPRWRQAPAYPTPDGLARAVPDWEAVPAPLVPLYLRRPDAKSLAEREVGNGGSSAGTTREFAR